MSDELKEGQRAEHREDSDTRYGPGLINDWGFSLEKEKAIEGF